MDRLTWLKLLIPLLLQCSLCKNSLATQVYFPPTHLFINNYPYVVELQRNSALANNQQSNDKLVGSHYQGHLPDWPQSWLRLSQIEGSWQGIAIVRGKVHTLSMTEQGVLIAEPLSDDPVLVCGSAHSHSNGAMEISRTPQTHSALQVISPVPDATLCSSTIDGVCLLTEMEFAFDTPFQQKFGAQAQAQALAIINIAEGFYRNDFNIGFHTLTLKMLNDNTFSPTREARDLLDEVLAQRTRRQLSFLHSHNTFFHLVTGRDFNGATGGIAFVDTMCHSTSVGISQLMYYSNSAPNIALTAMIVAHELGHNFGAVHDGGSTGCSGSFIMAPSINALATNFSSCSQDRIRNTIAELSRPERCLNYPAQVGIEAIANNPLEAKQGRTFTLDYQIEVQNGSVPVPAIVASGSVPLAQGQYGSVQLSGQPCMIASDNLSFNCVMDDPDPLLDLHIMATANAGTAHYTLQVAVAGSLDIIDMDTSDNSAIASLQVSAEPQLPNAASALSVVQVAGQQVSISWQDHSDNETGFRLERSTNAGNFIQIAALASDTTEYIDSGTVAGSTYRYRLIAFNDFGDAAASNIASITPHLPQAVTTAADNNSAGGAGAGGGGGSGGWPSTIALLLLVMLKRRHSVAQTAPRTGICR